MSDVYGPPLPPGFKQNSSNSAGKTECDSEEGNTFIGPQCPASFLANKRKQHAEEKNDSGSASDADSESDDSEGGVYGPLPAASSFRDDTAEVIARMEKRAENMKKKLKGPVTAEPEAPKREEWMTVPNTSSRNQLGALSRCLSQGTSDDKKRRKEVEKQHRKTSKKDKEISKELEKYTKAKRSKSLLEMHQKSKKNKDKESSKPAERKPFNRDDELSLRFMDKNQINSCIDKAKFLDSRFSRGASHYL